MFHTDTDPGVVADFTINIGDVRQTIDGFGAAQSGIGLDATKADLLFSTSSGIGLSMFRLAFASNSTGPAPYYPETATMATFYNDAVLAAARGVTVWAAPWAAMDATWHSGGVLNGGSLLASHYADFATFCAGLQADVVANGGPTLSAQSVLNEPDYATSAYTSMTMSASEVVTYVKNNLGPALAALSPRPRLVVPECSSWDNSVTYLAALAADAAAYAYVDIVATHQYSGTVTALATAKHVWQSEMSYFNAFDPTMTNALVMAADVHSALTTGNVNAWLYWWAYGQNADNEGLIGFSGGTQTTKRLYALGNWSKFVRPTHLRIGTTGSVANLSLTAFRSTTGLTTVVVINSGTAQTVTVGFNGLHYTAMTPWITDATRDLVAQTAVPVSGNVFSATVPASSVTSFVGTGT